MGHDEGFIHNLWMSDEAHFHLHDFVNKQNFHYWSEENPCQLHSEQVTMKGEISFHCIIGP
jgi:hypothetical protein